MKTRRRKISRGGDAISGQQGCVIIPSLVVDAKMKTRNVNFVTKIFYKDADFYEEKASNDLILSTIDPRGSFTAANYTTEPADSRYLTPSELQQCPDLVDSSTKAAKQNLKYLNYRFIGKSIHEIVEKDMRITPDISRGVISALANLSVKVAYMNNELKRFHNDMHEGNIMYNFKDEHAYLIDFAKLGDAHNSAGPLTDMEGIVIALRLFITSAIGQRRLPKVLLDQLALFTSEAPAALVRPKVEEPVFSRTRISKFLTDFSLKYTTAVSAIGGRRKHKTLRRAR